MHTAFPALPFTGLVGACQLILRKPADVYGITVYCYRLCVYSISRGMRPEELNRSMEFLVQHMEQMSVHMDQLSVHMDQLSEHMDQLARRQERDFEWSKGLFERIADVVEVQSRRLNQCDDRI